MVEGGQQVTIGREVVKDGQQAGIRQITRGAYEGHVRNNDRGKREASNRWITGMCR